PFDLPSLLSIGEVGGRTYAIERRLTGRSMLQELERAEGAGRDRLIEAYLEAAYVLGEAPLRPRDYFGDLVSSQPVRSDTWRGYLVDKAAASLASGGLFANVDPRALAEALPDSEHAGLVHLDAFAGNMMTHGGRITAVLDLGPACVAGDPRFNAVCAAVYLAAPQVTPPATSRDGRVAEAWLRSHGLLELVRPVRRWLGAYWAFAVDDPKVIDWCRLILE
ncbi:MAG TPA: phosphotransferase, partial [Candidatus Saccharimonadales bacterium]|nr:phosphotransferase [Candidatus Saccharimonadales bacterium]